MATTFKTFSANDIVTTKTLLHEAIPLTGTIVSGTYADQNIKNYSHGMFQSVYDYPYLSSSANHIFDISLGYHVSGTNNGTDTSYDVANSLSASANVQNSKKLNIYNQMAQVLMGYDTAGNIRRFDEDGNIADGGTKLNACIFVNFSRLLTKDEIKKGSFSMELDVGTTYTESGNSMTANRIKLYDKDAQNNYFVNSPAGDYAILYADTTTSSPSLTTDDTTQKAGLLFYQAGIAVISGSVFDGASNAATAQLDIPAESSTNLSVSDINGNTIQLIDTAGTATTLTFDSSVSAHTSNKVGILGVGSQNELQERIIASINANITTITATDATPSVGATAAQQITLTQDVAGANGNTIITRSNTNAFQVRLGATNFTKGGTGGILVNTLGAPVMNSSNSHNSFLGMLTGSEISASADAIRHRLFNIEFNNTTELNSTVYFCRVHHNEFNYSTNPTYLGTGSDASKIAVKNVSSDSPVAYVTGVGLYSSDNELLASAKLSEPLRKDPTNELTLRVRLDY